jgi:hypothetical protein
LQPRPDPAALGHVAFPPATAKTVDSQDRRRGIPNCADDVECFAFQKSLPLTNR